MKNLPKLPDEIAELIGIWIDQSMWIDGSDMKKIYLSKIKEFYESLKIKHSSSREYYRGIRITDKGFDELCKTGSVKLRSHLSESWSCRKNVSMKFLPSADAIKLGSGGAGILLARSIPSNKIWFNIDAIGRKYKKAYVDYENTDEYWDTVSSGKWPIGEHGYAMLSHLHTLKECELVTSTVCTKCKLDECALIRFLYEEDNEYIPEFLDRLKLNKTDMYDFEHKINHRYVVELVKRGSNWNINSYGAWG